MTSNIEDRSLPPADHVEVTGPASSEGRKPARPFAEVVRDLSAQLEEARAQLGRAHVSMTENAFSLLAIANELRELGATTIHDKDEDCAIDIAGVCVGCGVAHGEPCEDCGGTGFHRGDCAIEGGTRPRRPGIQ